MAFSLSPAVQIKETDLTAIIPAVATSTGAFAGEFQWGPVLDVTQVSNENVLVSTFGKPTTGTFTSFFSASNFLSYSNNLLLVRAATTGMLNAVATGAAVLIKNISQYESSYIDGQGAVGLVAAKYPGTLGNSLKVSMADKATFSRTLTGTIATTSGSPTITGTGTLFTEELAVGSFVEFTISGTKHIKQVTAIASDVSITVSTNVSATGVGLTAIGRWEYYAIFDGAPVDSNQAVAATATGDGLHMVVVDEDGQFTGVAGTVLERFDNVSKASNGLRFDGTSGFYKTVLNKSKYVWWMDHPETSDVTASGTDFGLATVPGAYKDLKKPLSRALTGGVDGSAATDGELQTAFDLFKNAERYDISLLFTGKTSADVARYVIQSIAEVRLDCVAFVSPVDIADNSVILGDDSAAIEKIVEYRNTLNVSSSYGVLDSGFKYQYDKYNDVHRYIPLNGDIAGICARTDFVADPWFSPGGLNRGQVKNVTRLAVNPDKAARDELFKNGINPVVSFPGQGTVLFGDKTLMSRPSAFDAINVRRLFIVLEKAIATASKFFLFELNTDLTRQLFSSMITPFLRDVQGRQGITDFYVDVGATVNIPDTIDANELRANIFIKPARSIRTITLNFVATRTNASFTEIEI